MAGSVYPRPSKWTVDKRGQRRKAPLRPNEVWTDPDTGKTVKAGPNGSTWTWTLTTGRRADGTRRTTTRGGYRTRKEATTALTAATAAHETGDDRALAKAEQQPVGDYLAGWLAARAAVPAGEDNSIKPTTVDQYGNALEHWVAPKDADGRWRPLPWLGAIPLSKLSGDHLTALYNHLRRAGSRCRRCDGTGRVDWGTPSAPCPNCGGVGGRPLSSRSVHLTHTVLRMALSDAVEGAKLTRNPIDRVPRRQRPTHKAEPSDEQHWEPDEARQFLVATADDRLGPFWALALDTGARRGELCALRWSDVDLDVGRVTIHRNRVLVGGNPAESTVKGKRKNRTLDIHTLTVSALRSLRARQATERLAAGEAWEQEGEHVFTDELGRPLRPDSVSRWFDAAVKTAGLPPISLHGLRHTSATLALAAGVELHVLSERLGHADAKVTMGVYAHVLEEQQTDAAEQIGSQLYGESSR